MFQKLIQLANLPYQKLRSKTPTPVPSPPSPIITMKPSVRKERKRVSPRANKGNFTSTKLDQEQTPFLKKSRKSKSGTKKAPSAKTAPKVIKKAKKPAPSYHSRKDRAADRAAPARAAADRMTN